MKNHCQRNNEKVIGISLGSWQSFLPLESTFVCPGHASVKLLVFTIALPIYLSPGHTTMKLLRSFYNSFTNMCVSGMYSHEAFSLCLQWP